MKLCTLVLLYCIAAVWANTEATTIDLQQGDAAPSQIHETAVYDIVVGGSQENLHLDFDLNPNPSGDNAEQRILFHVLNQSLDGNLFKVCWSAIDPVDVALISYGEFIEMKVKPDAYSLQRRRLNATFNIDILPAVSFAPLAVYIGLTACFGSIVAVYVSSIL